jgi:hypothetical protein
MMEECQILISWTKKDLKMQEAKLVEEHVRDLHSFDRHDLSAELEELRVRVASADEEHVVQGWEAGCTGRRGPQHSYGS